MTLEVLETGPLTTVQDLGRPGWFHAGVGVSGAADQTSHRLANRLVGNAAGAATLGCLLGGAVLRAQRAVAITVTGAAVEVLVDGRPVGRDAVVGLRAGQELSLRYASAGLRAYLAVRGGIDVPPVLGSRSYDTLARLGPAPLAPGDLLPVGTLSEALPLVDQAPTAPLPAGTLHVRVTPGPHPAGSAAWKVSTTSPAARGPSRRRPTAWGCG